MTSIVRLGPTTVTVEETPNEVTIDEQTPSTITVTAGTSTSPSAGQQLINFSRSNLLSVVVGQTKFVFPVNAAILGVTASVATAPEGSDIIIDVNVDDISIFAPVNRPTIPEGQEVGSEATIFQDGVVNAGSYMTVDIDQVGSTTPGDYLGVTVRYKLI